MKRSLFYSIMVLAMGATPAVAITEADEKAAIAAAGFEDAEACSKQLKETIKYDVETLGLNADGIEEVLVTANDPADCIKYGSTRATLLIKDASGQWKANITGLYDAVKILAEGANGYPDITSGPGDYCQPIWRWNGSQYAVHKVCRFDTSVIPEEAAKVTPVRKYDHNGSLMTVDFEKGTIRYTRPKAAIAGTVQPETLLFEGTFTRESEVDDRMSIQGTAYVFKKGCDPAPYPVTGALSGSAISLWGSAPSRTKNSCAVLGTSSKSPHSFLTFYVPDRHTRAALLDQKVPGFTMPGAGIQIWSAGASDHRGAMDHSANVLFFREGKSWRVEAECQANNTKTRKWTSVKGKGYVSLVGSALIGEVGPLGRLSVADHMMTFENSVCGKGAPGYGTGD